MQAAALAGEEEALGINSREQLAEVEKAHEEAGAAQLMDEGVSIVDPGEYLYRCCGNDQTGYGDLSLYLYRRGYGDGAGLPHRTIHRLVDSRLGTG